MDAFGSYSERASSELYAYNIIIKYIVDNSENKSSFMLKIRTRTCTYDCTDLA